MCIITELRGYHVNTAPSVATAALNFLILASVTMALITVLADAAVATATYQHRLL